MLVKLSMANEPRKGDCGAELVLISHVSSCWDYSEDSTKSEEENPGYE